MAEILDRLDRILPKKHLTKIEAWRWLTDHTAATLEAFYKITNKEGELVPLRPHRIQRKVIGSYEWARVHNNPWLADILKPRQVGLSTITSALCDNRTRHIPGTHQIVMSHDIASTKNIMDIYHTFEDNFPNSESEFLYSKIRSQRRGDNQHPGLIEWCRPVFDHDGKINWTKSAGSWITGIAASKAGGGASARANVLHVSEAGFNDAPWIDVLGTTKQCARLRAGDINVIEATAEENAGFWFDEYWAAKKMANSLSLRNALFFPFFIHDEYMDELEDYEESQLEDGDGFVIDPIGETEDERDEDLEEQKEIRDEINRYFQIDKLTGPSHANRRHTILQRRESVLKWRRYTIMYKYDGIMSERMKKFRKHYPWTDEVCWLSTSVGLFDKKKIGKKITDCHIAKIEYEKTVPKPTYPRWGNVDKTAWLIHPPSKNGIYQIFWDPTYGKLDYAAIMVINWAVTSTTGTKSTPRCDAIWRGKTDVGRQVMDCMSLAQHYKTHLIADPEIVPERNGPGMQAIALMQDKSRYNYKNIYYHRKKGEDAGYGFPTTVKSKPKAVALLERFVYDIIVDYEQFWQQANAFAPQKNGTIKGDKNSPDEFMSCAWMIAQVGVDRGYFVLPETDGDSMTIPVMDAPIVKQKEPNYVMELENNKPKRSWRTRFMNR